MKKTYFAPATEAIDVTIEEQILTVSTIVETTPASSITGATNGDGLARPEVDLDLDLGE